MKFLAIFLIFGGLLCLPLCAKENFEEEVKSLINQLASSNKEPESSEEEWDGLILPDDWDAKAQEKIYKAIQKLSALGKPAFPILIKHFDDERFSQIQSSSIEYTVSVGTVCRQIIMGNVRLIGMRYKIRTGKDGKRHGCPNYFYVHYKGDIKAWWQANKDKTLQEMRIEVLIWRIKQEEKTGFPNEERKATYMGELKSKLEELRDNLKVK